MLVQFGISIEIWDLRMVAMLTLEHGMVVEIQVKLGMMEDIRGLET